MNGTSLTSFSPGTCPALFGGSCHTPGWRKTSFGYLPVYISIASCSASCMGSALIIIAYLLFKDIRTGIRKIITYLAIADVITAAGYLLGNLNFIYYKRRVVEDEVSACYLFDTVCQIQAYVTSWSSLSSFIWTAILAVYLHSVLVKGDCGAHSKRFPAYHVLSWGSPMFVMLPLLCTGKLGYTLFAAGGWCFINAEDITESGAITYDLNLEAVVLILIGGKAAEVITYVLVIVFYSKIQWNIRRKMEPTLAVMAKKAEHKLALIPVIFILLRMWGTLQFIFSIIVKESQLLDSTGCVSTATYYIYLVFTCAQAFGDGGQGWGNAILYIFWSRKMRQQLIILPMRACFLRFVNYFVTSSDHSSLYCANQRTPLLVGGGRCHTSPAILPGQVRDLEEEKALFHPKLCLTSSVVSDANARESKESERLHLQYKVNGPFDSASLGEEPE